MAALRAMGIRGRTSIRRRTSDGLGVGAGKLESHVCPAAARIAAARPWQSYILTLAPLLVVIVTDGQAFSTAAIAAWLPVRVSPGRRMDVPAPVSPITQSSC